MENSKTIYLIRHCEAEGQGPDAALTLKGKEQSIQLANLLKDKGIQLVVSSTYRRAVESIRPLSIALNIPIHKDERLSERVLSPVSIENWQFHLEESFADLDLILEGGESSIQAMNRGILAIQEYLNRLEDTLAIITHGNLLALILKYYQPSIGYNEWRKLTNPDVFQLIIEKDQVTINRVWRN